MNKVENKNVFRASPGKYLRRSTLVTLARNISGLELPPSIYYDNTFEKSEKDPVEDDDCEKNAPVVLAGQTIVLKTSDKELIDHMDELVARVSLEPPQAKNEEALEEDGEVLYSERTWDGDR